MGQKILMIAIRVLIPIAINALIDLGKMYVSRIDTKLKENREKENEGN